MNDDANDDAVEFAPPPGAVPRDPIRWKLGARARVREVLRACAAAGFRRALISRRLLDIEVELEIPDIATIEDLHMGVIDALRGAGIQAETISGDTDRYFLGVQRGAKR